MISPFSPHLGEELWRSVQGNKDSVFNSRWEDYDRSLATDSEVEIGVQINGKLRGTILIEKDLDKDSVFAISKDIENVQKYLSKGTLIKEIYVPGKIVNFVIKQ